MIVMGLDPGLATTGWGVVSSDNGRVIALDYGVVLTAAGQPLIDRLATLAVRLRELVKAHRPQAAAVEELFFSKDSRSAAAVGHARGVLLLVLKESGLPIFEYNPRAVKMALTGFGAADKSQMQHMVQRLLSLALLPRPDDAADALAVALCHAQSAPLAERLAQARPGRARSGAVLTGRAG